MRWLRPSRRKNCSTVPFLNRPSPHPAQDTADESQGTGAHICNPPLPRRLGAGRFRRYTCPHWQGRRHRQAGLPTIRGGRHRLPANEGAVGRRFVQQLRRNWPHGAHHDRADAPRPTPEDPQVAKSLKYLESFVRDDGGIHQKGTFYRNYETCLAIMCFAEANQNGKYDDVIRRADRFVKGIQWAEDEDKDPTQPEYGGGGYGKHKRPDLSNTSFLVDALRAAGNDADSDAMQRALIFMSRCQNLESAHNKTPFSAKVNDGGFYYTPAAGGSSQAGETANGGLRSYGAMTYAGLKSMLFAGVGPEDQRVKAAVAWVQKHYDLSTNPGLGDAGLYYYYHVFAKALDALGQDVVTAHDGQRHHWKAELVGELAARQKLDGSWSNTNERWMEGDANLATGFCAAGAQLLPAVTSSLANAQAFWADRIDEWRLMIAD